MIQIDKTLFIKVYEDVSEDELEIFHYNNKQYLRQKPNNKWRSVFIDLPLGKWQLLGRALEVKEEDKKLCVETDHDSGFGVPMYKIYTAKSWTTESIEQSYKSLLEANNIDNNYVVLYEVV